MIRQFEPPINCCSPISTDPYKYKLEPLKLIGVTLFKELTEQNKAPPMTWGQVKATTLHAQQMLRQHGQEETPENLVAAVFAVITANSVTLLLIFSGQAPL
uniref:Uncharacterized protein n=1 Tax=Salvator merianae TaxID=96440 RepID=A0A8D0B5F5_SALMN